MKAVEREEDPSPLALFLFSVFPKQYSGWREPRQSLSTQLSFIHAPHRRLLRIHTLQVGAADRCPECRWARSGAGERGDRWEAGAAALQSPPVCNSAPLHSPLRPGQHS